MSGNAVAASRIIIRSMGTHHWIDGEAVTTVTKEYFLLLRAVGKNELIECVRYYYNYMCMYVRACVRAGACAGESRVGASVLRVRACDMCVFMWSVGLYVCACVCVYALNAGGFLNVGPSCMYFVRKCILLLKISSHVELNSR